MDEYSDLTPLQRAMVLSAATQATHSDTIGIIDSDAHFIIDPTTRKIINNSGKSTLVQYDHNSERLTFEMPRYIEGHDMANCNKVAVNYLDNTKSGLYEVDDLAVNSSDADKVNFTWLISSNVTQEIGQIHFAIAFKCIQDDDTITYEWHTDINKDLQVILTIDNGNIVVYKNVDVLEQWKRQLFELKGDQTIETILPADAVCPGTYRQGILDSTYKYNIATISYIKPFVVSVKVVSADYQLSVVVYKNGVYFKTEGWLSNGTVYTFDHTTYQYKLYIGKVVNGYINDFEECRKSIMLTISTADILKSYNELEIKNEIERRNTKNAVEYMMRRKYDISYANAPAPLGLITYVGNNQVVHPKVLYFPNKFGNRKYWMAYTPYPFANDKYENPCVAYSSDGYNWTNIDGNPLDDPAGDGYNSDTHLVYVESTGTLEIWYRYVSNYNNPPVSEIIYRQTTKDGINWTEKEVVVNNASGKYVQWLSPAVIHDGGKYKVWVVDDTTKTINYYESTVASSAVTINLDDSMTVGKVDQNGRFDTSNTDYMHTEKIKLNAAKSFQLTGVNLKGTKIHPAIRCITAYDASGNVLADYSQQNIAEASAAVGRTITMNASVDSVIVTIYKASNYTDKAITLPAVGSDNGLTKVRDITLTYQADGKTYTPWHLDVIEDNGKTVLLTMCKSGTTWSLFLSTSVDNITFTTPELVIAGNPYGWDTRLYRSSIVNVDGEYRIYYSAQNEIQKYGLGVCTSDKLLNFVGKW